MANDEPPFNLAAALGRLRPKDKAPRSTHVLTVWITQAESQLHSDGGRLGWLVASTVVAAALQAAVDSAGEPLFLLKGGSMLQHRLPGLARATTDLDGLVRGDLETFITTLDSVLKRPWGPVTFSRGKTEVIDVPNKLVKPTRFDLTLSINGVTWRRIQVEVSPDEGNAGLEAERIAPPSLAGFGLPTPDHLVTLALRYQIAQKVHAATDPHDPPDNENDRARDAVDLLLLRDLAHESGYPSLVDIHAAIVDIFDVRAMEASATGREPRYWPARLVAYPHWETSYTRAAESAGVTFKLGEAVRQVNTWLDEIDQA